MRSQTYSSTSSHIGAGATVKRLAHTGLTQNPRFTPIIAIGANKGGADRNSSRQFWLSRLVTLGHAHYWSLLSTEGNKHCSSQVPPPYRLPPELRSFSRCRTHGVPGPVCPRDWDQLLGWPSCQIQFYFSLAAKTTRPDRRKEIKYQKSCIAFCQRAQIFLQFLSGVVVVYHVSNWTQGQHARATNIDYTRSQKLNRAQTIWTTAGGDEFCRLVHVVRTRAQVYSFMASAVRKCQSRGRWGALEDPNSHCSCDPTIRLSKLRGTASHSTLPFGEEESGGGRDHKVALVNTTSIDPN